MSVGLNEYTFIPLDMWSDCSNSDFINWWRKEGHACVKEGKGITKQPITCHTIPS